jgi:hypothetical protein
MLTCTLVKVLLSIGLGGFDNYWQPRHAIGYFKRSFIQELSKQEKPNFSTNTNGGWKEFEHMITYMTYDHEATETCQVQPRIKKWVSFKTQAYCTHRKARNVIIRPNTVTVSMGASSASVLQVKEVRIKWNVGCKDITGFTSVKSLAAVHTSGGTGR